MHTSLDIVIPVYNEKDNIGTAVAEIDSKVKTPHRIHIVYDFEEDDTLPAVRALPNAGEIRLVKNKFGRGAGNAIKTGFETAEASVILVAMADLSDDFSKIDDMFSKINEGYDLVCGSRYMKGGKQIGGPKFKSFLSRMAGLTLCWFARMPVHDITNSFKMYTKAFLNGTAIESTAGFELGMELVIKAVLKGYRVTEIPCVSPADRVAGKAKFKLWKWLPHYLRWYFLAFKNVLRSPKE